MVVVMGIGFMLYLIPAVIAIVFLAFTPFVFAAKDLGLIDSFSNGNRYVSN
jgi:hypothetical protein